MKNYKLFTRNWYEYVIKSDGIKELQGALVGNEPLLS